MKDSKLRVAVKEMATILGLRVVETKDGALHIASGELGKRYLSRGEHYRDMQKLSNKIDGLKPNETKY